MPPWPNGHHAELTRSGPEFDSWCARKILMASFISFVSLSMAPAIKGYVTYLRNLFMMILLLETLRQNSRVHFRKVVIITNICKT